MFVKNENIPYRNSDFMDCIEDYIAKFLKKVKEDENQPFDEEIIDLLRDKNAVQYFKFNLQQYCELISLSIKRINNVQQSIRFLKHENMFQKILIEREEFVLNFFNILLPTLIEFCYISENDEKLFVETSNIIQKCIFSKHLHEFDCFLTKFFEDRTCTEKHSLCKNLFKFFLTLYSSDYSTYGFKLIFHSYSKSYKNFTVAYKLFLVITQLIGFDILDQFNFKVKYKIQKPSLIKSLEILSEILDVTVTLKFDSDSTKLNNQSFTDFLKSLLQSVIALSCSPNRATYQILLNIVEINPLIIESSLDKIIVYVMLTDNTNCKKEYEQLMIKIFEVFNKLHRIQNLISKMIPTLKNGIENRELNQTIYIFRGDLDSKMIENYFYNVEDIFPKSVLNYFTNCIIHLASWQVINLFKTLLFHLNKAVEELPEDGVENVYIEILTALMSWLLQSVRMAEHTVILSTVLKFIEGLKELRTILGNFGRILLQKEHNHILVKSFLNTCYYWAEIFVILEYYSITDEIRMTKNLDSNFSACNITYLHSYLSDKEWCLIAERIHNFGGKECQKIMQKLMIQKYKAFIIFGANTTDIINPIIREISSNIEENSLDILTDRFVISNVLDKMPPDSVLKLADFLVKDLVEGNLEIMKRPHIYDSEIMKNAIFSVISTKINKLLKQKRKLDEISIRKPLYSKITSILPSDMFLCNNLEEFLRKGVDIVISSTNEENILDIKIYEKNIQSYLEILTRVPIVFSQKNGQKLFILLMSALNRDLKNSNCDDSLQRTCEKLVISVLQHNKFTLLDLFKADDLLRFLTENFERSEDVFLHIAQSVFRNDNDVDVTNFESGIDYIKNNIKEKKCLNYSITVINLLNKIKKIKISPESKELCLKYKSILCHKLVKIIEKDRPEDRFIEAYALVLKTLLARDDIDSLNRVKTHLNDYIEYCLCNLSDCNLKGYLLLFTTILNNKTTLNDLNDNVISRIWDSMKKINIHNEVMEDYSNLVRLIATLIPNEQFTPIFEDLLRIMDESANEQRENEFRKHLKTWTCIVSTNFNPTKTNILREQLEFLIEKIIFLLKSTEFSEEFYEELIQFEVSIIQAVHVPLTSAIMDSFLLTASILMMNKSYNFVNNFSVCVFLLGNLLKYRNPLIMDRLPPYLLQYRVLLKELCQKCSSDVTLLQNEEHKIADCAHKLEKLTKSLVDCSKDMARIAMYLVADILVQYEENTLHPPVKKHLDNCIYSLISLFDQHAVEYLLRVLSNASTEIFKFMYENYRKYYRFTGKV